MPVRDFFLDANGRLAVVAGDFALVGGATDAEHIDAVKQGIRIRVLLFLGEYYLDESEGVDYLGQILIRNANPLVVRELLRQAIASTPDVTEVVGAELLVDAATREASISYEVLTAYSAAAVSGSVEVP